MSITLLTRRRRVSYVFFPSITTNYTYEKTRKPVKMIYPTISSEYRERRLVKFPTPYVFSSSRLSTLRTVRTKSTLTKQTFPIHIIWRILSRNCTIAKCRILLAYYRDRCGSLTVPRNIKTNRPDMEFARSHLIKMLHNRNPIPYSLPSTRSTILDD